MSSEIECLHCRKVFPLPENALGRSIRCPACEGVIAVVPVVEAVPAVPAIPLGPSFPEFKEAPKPEYLPPEVRGRRLAPPWPRLRQALHDLHAPVILAAGLYCFYLLVDLLWVEVSPA